MSSACARATCGAASLVLVACAGGRLVHDAAAEARPPFVGYTRGAGSAPGTAPMEGDSPTAAPGAAGAGDAAAAGAAGGPRAARSHRLERPALPPWHGWDVSRRQPLEARELGYALARKELVCVGEHHDDPRHHAAQLAVLAELQDRAELAGRELGLGLEMWERRFQPVLDRYAARELDERSLLRDTEWRERWGHDYALYRPIVRAAVADGAALLALGARRELARAVARRGVDALAPDDRADLPELDLDDQRHRERFTARMDAHPHDADADRLYAAQVVRDETMAAVAAAWLSARRPARQLVVLAGAGHCEPGAIPARAKRRGVERVVSVLPVTSHDDPELAHFDYGVVVER
ncbi:MAG: ChaN family lipoprotein [Polyangiaceae bacterium]|nr:ChaN family lipoprotein [Polyangiaceae bacterium]